MKKAWRDDYSNARVTVVIGDYIHSSRDREIILANLVDGVSYDELAGQYAFQIFKSTFLQSKYDDTVRQLNKVETENAVKAQTEYLLSVMGKWIANPAAVAVV